MAPKKKRKKAFMEVFHIRYSVTWEREEESTNGDTPWQQLLKDETGRRPILRERIKGAVSERLGEDFSVQIYYSRGSFDLLVIVTTVASVIIGYGELRAGARTLVDDIRKIVRDFFAPTTEVKVSSGFLALGEVLLTAESKPATEKEPRPVVLYLLVLYLVISNIALILFLGFLLFRAVAPT